MANNKGYYGGPLLQLLIWAVLAAGGFIADPQLSVPLVAETPAAAKEAEPKPAPAAETKKETEPAVKATPPKETAEKGLTLLRLVAIIAAILAVASLCRLFTIWYFNVKRKPAAEGMMVGRIYTLIAALAILLSLAWGFGKLTAFSSFFAMFGGMLLGFSLQAPVSGFAAWVLISLKRPFRPGDRVQFPNLGLTGDVKDIGIMYTVLDQVGGSIGSEEAVGRYILVPNAMLFSQVAINYTVTQDSPYMLDEVVVRITFNSNWDAAEKLMLKAAQEITQDIIAATGVKPYIRSDLYDYGVYMRLRYQTAVKDRAEIAYGISKKIFEQIQRTSEVDLAIPFVYSARAGQRVMNERQEAPAPPADAEAKDIRDVEIAQIHPTGLLSDIDVVEQLSQSIATHGLLQPIVVIPNPQGTYDVVAGQLRLEACKRLGWKKIPAVIRGSSRHERVTPEHLDRSSSGK